MSWMWQKKFLEMRKCFCRPQTKCNCLINEKHFSKELFRRFSSPNGLPFDISDEHVHQFILILQKHENGIALLPFHCSTNNVDDDEIASTATSDLDTTDNGDTSSNSETNGWVLVKEDIDTRPDESSENTNQDNDESAEDNEKLIALKSYDVNESTDDDIHVDNTTNVSKEEDVSPLCISDQKLLTAEAKVDLLPYDECLNETMG